jgi:anaerobic ribonucleoside-triphosphate reductase
MTEKKIPTEIYSRCCGYFRPLNNWNLGKQSEFADRKTAIVTSDIIKKELTTNIL